jgi:hypothetical protein
MMVRGLIEREAGATSYRLIDQGRRHHHALVPKALDLL